MVCNVNCHHARATSIARKARATTAKASQISWGAFSGSRRGPVDGAAKSAEAGHPDGLWPRGPRRGGRGVVVHGSAGPLPGGDYLTSPTEPPSGFRGYGHYAEQYVRDEGDWRIKRLVLTRLRVDSF